MLPESWNGKLIPDNIVAQFNYISPNQQIHSIGHSSFCPLTAGYTMVRNSKDSLLLESYPILPPKKNANSLARCILGSLAVVRWPQSDDPEFVLATIPLAMLELEISPLRKYYKEAEAVPSMQPLESRSISKFASECSIAVTVRNFGVSIWEHFFPGLGNSHMYKKTMIFDLLESLQHKMSPQNIINLQCAQDVREGLVFHTRTGFRSRIPFATVLDVTLFNPDGLVVWAFSQPVQLCQETGEKTYKTNLSISGLSFVGGLSGSIRDPVTSSSLKVEFCFGNPVESKCELNGETKTSSFVQAVILELNEDTVQSWIL